MLQRHAATGFPAVVARPAAIYGPDNNIFDMETPMFLRLLRELPILVPHGGLVVGSYGHVDDLCDAILVAAEHPAAPGEVFNITGQSCDVHRYIATLAEVVGAEPRVVHVPDTALDGVARPPFGHLLGRRHHAMLGTGKAERVLGVRPRYDLLTGHRQTYDWFRAQGWASLDHPLVDPVWRASWDFTAEAELAEAVRRG
jgi:nucleoside-diphosphate-sugar epimerase